MGVAEIVLVILYLLFLLFVNALCYNAGCLKGLREGEKIADECIEEVKSIYSEYIDELEEEIRKMQEGRDE